MKHDRAARFVSKGFAGVTIKRGDGKGEPLLAGRTARIAPKSLNLNKPVKASADLAKITGSAPLPRSQVVSKVWDHIRKNNLQNPKDKREIMADSTLKPIFGGKDRVSMFEMNKHLSNHLKSSGESDDKKKRTSSSERIRHHG